MYFLWKISEGWAWAKQELLRALITWTGMSLLIMITKLHVRASRYLHWSRNVDQVGATQSPYPRVPCVNASHVRYSPPISRREVLRGLQSLQRMHALVFWLQDEQFSVVDANDVILDETNSMCVKEGNTYPVKWRERRGRKIEELVFDAQIKSISGR